MRRCLRSGRAVSAPIILWHGSKRWEGPPRIVESKKGRVEHGPGLYLSTSAETARKYARGGGSVMRFEIEPNLRWVENVEIPFEAMVRFLHGRARLRSRQAIVQDVGVYRLRVSEARKRPGKNTEMIPAAVLVNLMVNHNAITGEHGPALVEFLVANGVDAGIDHKGSEDWIVLFDLSKVRSYKKVPAGEAVDAERIKRTP